MLGALYGRAHRTGSGLSCFSWSPSSVGGSAGGGGHTLSGLTRAIVSVVLITAAWGRGGGGDGLQSTGPRITPCKSGVAGARLWLCHRVQWGAEQPICEPMQHPLHTHSTGNGVGRAIHITPTLVTLRGQFGKGTRQLSVLLGLGVRVDPASTRPRVAERMDGLMRRGTKNVPHLSPLAPSATWGALWHLQMRSHMPQDITDSTVKEPGIQRAVGCSVVWEGSTAAATQYSTLAMLSSCLRSDTTCRTASSWIVALLDGAGAAALRRGMASRLASSSRSHKDSVSVPLRQECCITSRKRSREVHNWSPSAACGVAVSTSTTRQSRHRVEAMLKCAATCEQWGKAAGCQGKPRAPGNSTSYALPRALRLS